MDISRFDPCSLDLESADLLAAVAGDALEGVVAPRPNGATLLLALTVADGEGPADGLWVATEDKVPVGYAVLTLPRHENPDLAQLRGAVAPVHQRRGIGRALLAEVTAATDRPRLRARAWVGAAGERALPRLGFGAGQTHVVRRLDLHEAHDHHAALRREVADAAADYELVRRTGPTPAADLPEMVVLREAINDAPDEGEFEAYPPERIAAYETALTERRQTQYAIVARHRSTGEPAGITLCCVDEFMPEVAFQEDTSVLPAHRGHRLGLLLKLEMADWLRRERPEVAATDTWNARDNHHMIAVNERLGLRTVAESTAFHRDR